MSNSMFALLLYAGWLIGSIGIGYLIHKLRGDR